MATANKGHRKHTHMFYTQSQHCTYVASSAHPPNQFRITYTSRIYCTMPVVLSNGLSHYPSLISYFNCTSLTLNALSLRQSCSTECNGMTRADNSLIASATCTILQIVCR